MILRGGCSAQKGLADVFSKGMGMLFDEKPRMTTDLRPLVIENSHFTFGNIEAWINILKSYLGYLFKQLPLAKTEQDVQALLPWNVNPKVTDSVVV